MAKNNSKLPFSKTLLIQESVLIWVMTLGFLFLAFLCVFKGYTGSLPWLAAMVSFPWAAYGVSQVYYYKKSLAENTKDGIIYQTAVAELESAASRINTTSQTPATTTFMTNTIDPFGPI